MSLKFKIDSLDGLTDDQKKLYKAGADGKFVLDVEGGDDDTAGLKSQNEKLLDEVKEAKKKLRERDDAQKAADEKARKSAEDAARAAGNVEALEKSWQTKHEAALAAKDSEYKPQVEKLSGAVQRLLVVNVAAQLAREIAVQGCDRTLIPHIQQRLRVEEREGEMVTVVVDANGKASASTIEDIKKEFSSDPAFAPVIAGSKASGSGAGGGGSKGGGAAGQKEIKRADFDQLSDADKAAKMKDRVKVID